MTEQPLRLPAGGAVDRGAPLRFRFDGRRYTGYAGDTLAAALLANGRRLVARSFKYHRPRGIHGLGSEEPNALVSVGRGARRDVNARATAVELYEGLEACSQNRWPSLRFDIGAVGGLLSPLFPAGFYYKTFMRPAAFWEPVYERLIRRAAGLGRAERLPDPDAYAHGYGFCDVLVVGAGPAGLAAARAAAEAGAEVLLVEERPWLGGRLAVERETVEDRPAADWLAEVEAALEADPRVTVCPRTAAFGLYDHDAVGLIEQGPHGVPAGPRERSWTVRARQVVFATGALEQPVAFAGNDRPGVMLSAAARGYVNRFAVAPGRRTLVFAAHPDGYRTAFDLLDSGAGLAGVVDPRPELDEGAAGRLADAGVPLYRGACVERVFGRAGVRGARLGPTSRAGEASRRITCDALAVAGGWQPVVHLQSHLGARPRFDEDAGVFLPPETAGQENAGACAGFGTTAECLQSGRTAGLRAAAACGYGAAPDAEAATSSTPTLRSAPVHVVDAGSGDKRFVDLQNDVTVDDIELAHREGYRSVEHLKRYTTLGMATDQGKTSNLLGLEHLARLREVAIAEAGTTTFRPPWNPVTVGALAGRETGERYRPLRESPLAGWHRGADAAWMDAGLWRRPRYYPQHDGESLREAYLREAAHVRRHAGIVDVSTLGKIEVIGPDASTLVERLYCNGMASLPVGKLRYGVMLRDDGFVFDDGTVCRLADTRYLLTTTTANAGPVLAHIEYLLETAWTDLRVQALTVSDRWGGFAIAGPRSRDVLAALLPALALDDRSFPFLGVRETAVDGIGLLVMRNSYSGERAYEVFVPADYAEALWVRALEVGQRFELRPYGTEAMGTLRIEKGHVAGPELDGRTTLEDLGLEGLVRRKRSSFVGQVLRQRPALQSGIRPRLVGLQADTATAPLRAGALLRAADGDGTIEGHVSSVTCSPEHGRMIGLGFLTGGLVREGEVVRVHDPLAGRDLSVRVTRPVFVDPAGERLHA